MPRLVISCPRYGLVFLDTDHESLCRLHPTRSDVHTGLHGTERYAWWVYNGTDLVLLRGDGEIHCRLQLPDPAGDYHGVFTSGKQTWVINPTTSSLVMLDEEFAVVNQRSVLPGSEDFEDACHLNDIWQDQETLYSTMFVACDTLQAKGSSETWRHCPNDGVLFSWERDGISEHIHGLSSPHSPRIYGNYGLVCNSGLGEVWLLDRTNGTWDVRKRCKMSLGFTRGIVRHGDVYFVGVSSYRGSEGTQASIVQMASDGQMLKQWELPCREIYDLHIMADVTDDQG